MGGLVEGTVHGAVDHGARARADVRRRTVFNLLGPLTNPAGACGKVIGVYDRARIRDLAQVLADTGTRHADGAGSSPAL